MADIALDDRGLVTSCPACGQKNRFAYDRLGDAVRCGKCKAALDLPGEPIEVTSSSDFDTLIAHSPLPVLVDYWAPWCGPCRMVAPEVQKVAARRAGRALVVKVNTDQLSDLGQGSGSARFRRWPCSPTNARCRASPAHAPPRTSKRSLTVQRRSPKSEV